MKRGILKRAIGFTMACVMAISFVGCGGNADPTTSAGGGSAASTAAGGQKVIKFFHRFPDEPYNSFIEGKLHEYEKSHPDIKFDIMSAQNQDYKEKIKVVVGGDDTPDIFFSWAGDFTERFIRENLILDLTPYMDKDPEWKNSLLANQMSIYTNKDGMIYGIPFRLDCKQFFYNTELFQKNGIEAPKTFDDLLAACAKLKAAGVTPIAYGNSEPWAGLHYIGTLNQIFVPDDVRAKDYEPTTGEFTDPGYAQAMQYYQKLLPYMTENPDGVKPDMARSMFAGGQAAIYYGELIEIPYIKADGPDLKFGMFKFPQVAGAKGNQEILTGAPEGFVISSKTKYPQECVDFLKWFLGKDVGTEQCQKIGWFNAAKDTTKGLTDQSLIDGYKVVSEATQMSAWLDNALYSTVCKEYLEEVSNLTNGSVSPQEAMKKIRGKAKEAQTLVKTGKASQ